MIKPKPCPFCGGKVAVVICDDEGNLHWDKPTKKYCEDCGTKMDGSE